jgi:hypothetical protein
MFMSAVLKKDFYLVPTEQELAFSVAEKYQIAKTHDLSRVADFLVFREKMDSEYVAEAVEQYRRHMAILATYTPLGYDIPISDRVDPVWHTHILHTGDYTELCKKMGVPYIHHQPFIFEAEAQAIEHLYRTTTYSLHSKHFKIDEAYWGIDTTLGCLNKP